MRTMIFQIGLFLQFSILISVLFSIRFKTKLKIVRILPKYCTNGKKLSYRITIKNYGKKTEKGLFVVENPVDPMPSFDEFANTASI